MMSNNKSVVSSNWPGYHKLWVIVAIILLILLILLWLLGYGPGGKKCEVPPTTIEKTVEVEKLVDNPKLLTQITELKKDNSKIAGLMTTIKGLETDNGQIADLKAKISGLETENTKIAGFKTMIEGLKSDNSQLADLKAKVSGLETENTKIAGFMTTIKGLKSDNGQIADLKAKISSLQKSNEDIPRLQSEVKKYILENDQLPVLLAKTKTLETENMKIAALNARIKELESAEPKIKIVEKIVEKIIRVPAEPTAPAAPTAPVKVMAVPEKAKLYFDVGSSEFPADVNLSLAGVISYLKNNANSTAVVSGFHDSTGSLAKNKEISLKRAQEVAKLLTEAGVSIDRMDIEEPKETTGSGSPEEARRVEVKVVQ